MPLNRAAAIVLFGAMAAVALCSLQYGDNRDLNSMPFEKVAQLVSDLAQAKKLASEGNIDFLVGQPVQGKPVKLRGELTDANCYLGAHVHSYDHAFCAKLCVAAGSPLLLVSDENGSVYAVLSGRNGTRLGRDVLDQIGIPGFEVTGTIVSGNGLKALAIHDTP